MTANRAYFWSLKIQTYVQSINKKNLHVQSFYLSNHSVIFHIFLCTAAVLSRMWRKTIIFLALNIIHFNQSRTLEKNTLKNWVDELKLHLFTFPHFKDNKSFGIQNNVTPLVQVIDCSEPDAIYQYDYKVSIYIHILIKVFQ